MKKYAVIFASHIPSLDKLWIGEDILKKIREYLPDSDIYVGINPSSCTDEWITIIKQYTEHYRVTPENLVIGSDASAYQTALNLYKENKTNEYELVWFLHTQATKSNRHYVRENHINTLLVNKQEVIDFFNSDVKHGGYSSCYSPAPWILDGGELPIETVLDKYYPFKYSSFRYITIGTMYVIRGNVLDTFTFNCDDSFFNKPLSVYSDQTVSDLYFFERDFIQIVNRMGYIVGAKTLQNDYGIKVNDMISFYKENLKRWEIKNGL